MKEGIIEKMEEHFQTFQAEMSSGEHGACTLIFKDFWGCRALDFFGVKDPIISRKWILDMESAQMTSFCPEGLNMRFTAGCLSE